jgi:signal transduction histidine kinase/ActR/RegA family two-component response regulator
VIELLLGLPARVWILLALVAFVPAAVALIVPTTPPGRRLGLATRLASRAVGLMGLGFGAMALVATLSVLRTGLQEIRRRHLPAVVDLASELSRGHARAPDSVSLSRTLSLFRALQPEVGPVAAWGNQCKTRCLSVVAEPDVAAEARTWAERTLARESHDQPLHTVTLNGQLHLVIGGVLRNAAGGPEGGVAVAVRAGWVADRALQTAVALVVLAYLLLLGVGWGTRGMLAETVASRARDIAVRLRSATSTSTTTGAPVPADELALLDTAVSQHITDSVARLHEADRSATEARALAARMEATATLAAGVAHDFSNLMSGVMANCEVLRADVGDDPEALGSLETVVECATRASMLAQQLVAFARGGRYEPAVVNLNELVGETLRLESHTLSPKVTVDRRLAWDLQRIDADPTQLRQVISNLFRNAVEAIGTTESGRITVATWNVSADARPAALTDMPAGPYVALMVRDTGPGISAETRARVFEPFFTTKEGGRGMGLAATYGIVTHHGGRVDVESIPQTGTAFTVFLPATSAPLVSEAAQAAGVHAADATPTVLVVDDEVSVLTATSRLLERRGFRTLTAETPADALQIAAHADRHIHVVLLDLRMPGRSAVEMLDQLHAVRPDVRIILATLPEDEAEARALLQRGAVAVVRKPFRSGELGALIERLTGTAPAAS